MGKLVYAIGVDFAIVLALSSSALSVLAAVVSAWFARRAQSSDARKAVDELAETVERFTRIARREQMRRVRSATPLSEGANGEASAPPELAAAAPVLTPQQIKAELRARLLRGNRLT